MWMKKDPDKYRDVCKDDKCRNKRRAEDDVAIATNEMFGRLRRRETNETRVVNVYSGNLNGQRISSEANFGSSEELRAMYKRMRQVLPLKAPGYPDSDPATQTNTTERAKLNFAVHVRTGHGQTKGPYPRSFVPMVREVLDLLGEANLTARVLVYTELWTAELPELKALATEGVDIQIFRDPNRYLMFHGLAIADILVNSNSEFSHAAAMINDRMKLYLSPRGETFIHGMVHWNPCATTEGIKRRRYNNSKFWKFPKNHSSCIEVGFDVKAARRFIEQIPR
jgi:hypothetical protein